MIFFLIKLLNLEYWMANKQEMVEDINIKAFNGHKVFDSVERKKNPYIFNDIYIYIMKFINRLCEHKNQTSKIKNQNQKEEERQKKP